MYRRAFPPVMTKLTIALFGAALTGGCALIYNFDYASGSASSGAGGGSSSTGGHSSGKTSGNSSSGSAGGGGPSSSSSGAGGGAGGSGGSFPAPIFQVNLGGTEADMAGHPGIDFSVPNSEVFITGIFTNSIDLGAGTLSHTGLNFFLAMLDPTNGKAMWNSILGDSTGTVSSLAATPDGGVVVAGSFSPTLTLPNIMPVSSAGLHDMFVAKFDKAGNLQWHNEYGGGQEEYANAVAVDGSGIIYLTGSFTGGFMMGNNTVMPPTGSEGAFVAKFDPTGTCLWVHPFGDNAKGLSIAPVGNPPVGVAVGGMFVGTIVLGAGAQTITNMNMMTPAPFVAVLSAGNATLAVRSFIGTNINLGYDDAFTGGALFGITSFSAPSSNIGLGTIDKDGMTIYTPTGISGTANGSIESVARYPTGDMFLTGYYANGNLTLGKTIPNHGAEDIFLARLDQKSALLGGAGYGDITHQFGRNVRSDVGSHLYLFGDFQGAVDFGKGPLQSTGDYDMFLIKFDATAFSLH